MWNPFKAGRKAIKRGARAVSRVTKRIFHGVNKVLKKALSNPILRIVAISAASFFLTPAIGSMLVGSGGLFAGAAGTLMADVATGALTGAIVNGTVAGIEGKSIGQAASSGGLMGGAAGGLANLGGASATAKFGKPTIDPKAIAAQQAGNAPQGAQGTLYSQDQLQQMAANPAGQVAGGGNVATVQAANSVTPPSGAVAGGLEPRTAAWDAARGLGNGATPPPTSYLDKAIGFAKSDAGIKLIGEGVMGAAKGAAAGAAANADAQAQRDRQQMQIQADQQQFNSHQLIPGGRIGLMGVNPTLATQGQNPAFSTRQATVANQLALQQQQQLNPQYNQIVV